MTSTPELNITPDCFGNRELALLQFNERVLAQAQDARLPLLERMKFLCISCSNLDEFFEIRVAGLKQLQDLGSATIGPDRTPIPVQLAQIHARTEQLIADQYVCLDQMLRPALAETGIRILRKTEWSPAEREWLLDHFSPFTLSMIS